MLAAAPARAATTEGPGDKTIAVTVGPWRFLSGAPPAGWTEPGFDDRRLGWAGPGAVRSAPPAAARPAGAAPPPAAPVGTLYDLAPAQPLLLRARFSVADAAHARVLDLRVAYGDGFIAYVNGREVARRGMAPNGARRRRAARPRDRTARRSPFRRPSLPALNADGNLLAVAVFSWPGRSTVVPSTPAAWVDVGAASGVRIVRGPYLSTPTESKDGNVGMRLNWQTDLPATATVSVQWIERPSSGMRPLSRRGRHP